MRTSTYNVILKDGSAYSFASQKEAKKFARSKEYKKEVKAVKKSLP